MDGLGGDEIFICDLSREYNRRGATETRSLLQRQKIHKVNLRDHQLFHITRVTRGRLTARFAFLSDTRLAASLKAARSTPHLQ